MKLISNILSVSKSSVTKYGLLIVAMGLALAGCGKPRTTVHNEEVVTFTVKPSDPGQTHTLNNGGERIDLRMKTPEFDEISRPNDAPSDEQLKSSLATEIVSFKLLSDEDDLLQFRAEIEIINAKRKSENTFLSFSLARGNTSTLEMKSVSSSGDYSLRIQCEKPSCDRGWSLLHIKSKNEYAELKFERKEEYITNSDIGKAETKNIENELLRDAIEYSLPVVRHSSQVTNGETASRIVIETPPADEGDEPLSADQAEGSADQDEGSAKNEVALPYEPQAIELQGTLPTKPTSDTNDHKPTGKQTEKPTSAQSTPPAKVIPVSYRLTDNLSEAYGLIIPEQLLANTNLTIKDPLDIKANFSIVPVALQQPIEPAYRMSVLSSEFVKQKIKIWKHACNIFVRSIMTLSGYTKGAQRKANEFHLVFKNGADDLSKWQESYFFLNQSVPQTTSYRSLQKYLDSVTPEHAVVMQVRRPNASYGHVAIVVKEGNEIVVYDANMNVRGPRRKVVTPKDLMYRSSNPGITRENVYIYSMPGLAEPASSLTKL